MESEYHKENPFGLETESDFHHTRAKITIKLIREFHNNHTVESILDVGCGSGQITRQIKQALPEICVDAIDISELAIKKAIEKSPDINFYIADGMTYSTMDRKYDVVLLNNIYEHLENPIGMLMNVKGQLNDNGIIIISTPNRFHTRNVLRKLFGLKIYIPPYHITEYSIGQIFDHHRYVGLKIVQLLAPNYNRETWRIIDIIIFKVIQPMIDSYLQILKSRTKMGSLLFSVSTKIYFK